MGNNKSRKKERKKKIKRNLKNWKKYKPNENKRERTTEQGR